MPHIQQSSQNCRRATCDNYIVHAVMHPYFEVLICCTTCVMLFYIFSWICAASLTTSRMMKHSSGPLQAAHLYTTTQPCFPTCQPCAVSLYVSRGGCNASKAHLGQEVSAFLGSGGGVPVLLRVKLPLLWRLYRSAALVADHSCRTRAGQQVFTTFCCSPHAASAIAWPPICCS